MTDEDILSRVNALVEEEHRLRKAVGGGILDPSEEHRRLTEVELALDQCWDLLRQRRALRETGDNPDLAAPRSLRDVENYKQ